MIEQKCRVCGCTEDNCSQCIKLTGGPCHWVEEDLCSACKDAITIKSPINNSDMNFFQQLAEKGNVDITIRIMQKNDKLTMEIMPGSKKSTNKPYIITGTGAELDADFFNKVFPGVAEIKGLVHNLDDVKKDLTEKKEKKTTPASKPAAAKKAAPKKSAKPEKKKAEKKPEPEETVEASLFDEETK